MQSRASGWNRKLATLVVLVVAADWLTKFIVLNRVLLHQRIVLVADWLYVVRVRNEGIAFSLFTGTTAAWRAPLLFAVALIVVAVFARMVGAVKAPAERVGIALVIAGAVGNLGDRAVNGAVTDFVLVPFFPFIFNVADIAVVIGGTLLVLSHVWPRAATSRPAGP